MPTSKRASMREGPLAALFRKTAEDAADAKSPEEQKPRRAEPRRRRPLPRPSQEPRRGRHPAIEVPEPSSPERHVPSPQERLRQAFSADIPESLMDRPAPSEPAAREPRRRTRAPERVARARSRRRPTASAPR